MWKNSSDLHKALTFLNTGMITPSLFAGRQFRTTKNAFVAEQAYILTDILQNLVKAFSEEWRLIQQHDIQCATFGHKVHVTYIYIGWKNPMHLRIKSTLFYATHVIAKYPGVLRMDTLSNGR